RNPRFLADLTGDGRADIIGFGNAGVYVSLAGRTAFGPIRFVLPNFGFLPTILALVTTDREAQEAGVWRSSDGGGTWSRVHPFARPAGQLVWAPGSANLVYAAGSSSLAVSTDAGATFTNVMPMPGGVFQTVHHVAVAEVPAGSLTPP